MPDRTPDPAGRVHLIPLARIDDAALPRDRTGLDAEPLAELERSIAASGLRQPIEVFPLPGIDGAAPDAPAFGLLTGFRRFHAVAALHAAETEAGRPAPPVRRDSRLHPPRDGAGRRARRDGRGERDPRRPLAVRARPDRGPRPQRRRLAHA